MPKYQGKELTSTLQAPTANSLQEMIDSAQKYAGENKLEDFKVLEQGPDPDGGYRAIVTAHNWNPISWLKGKLTKKKKGEEEEEEEVTGVSTEVTGEDPKEVKKQEEKAWKTFEAQSKKEAETAKVRKEYQLKRAKTLRQMEDIGRKETQEEALQQQVQKLPPEHRAAAIKEMKEGMRTAEQAEIEIVAGGIPGEVITKQKVLQKEFWTKKGTDEPVPEPQTAEERARTDYHPAQWTYLDVPRKLSAPERAAIARAIQFEEMELGIAKEKYKQFRRERHPAYRAAKAAGGFGTFMAGAVTMGVAGAARGLRPGRGGPERAARMHAPGVPLELYRVRPMLGVGIPPAKVHTGAGLEHLRALTLPGIRRTRRQVKQVRRDVEQGER